MAGKLLLASTHSQNRLRIYEQLSTCYANNYSKPDIIVLIVLGRVVVIVTPIRSIISDPVINPLLCGSYLNHSFAYSSSFNGNERYDRTFLNSTRVNSPSRPFQRGKKSDK